MQNVRHGGDIYGNKGIELDFSVNTNPFGMPEEVRRALLLGVDDCVNYPDPHCRDLTAALAQREEVPPDWILCGNGAADLIYRLCYALKPQKALVCAPTFSEYERALIQAGAQVLHHTLKESQSFALTTDIFEALGTDTDVVFLCHPNNPTGLLAPDHVLEGLLERAQAAGTVVVVDECFLDFAREGVSCKKYLKEMPQLVILKAFTKMYGLAGLRLGYLLTGNRELWEKTDAAAQSWSVSVPAQIAGLAALSCRGWEKRTRELVEKERPFVSRHLRRLGLTVYASQANFLLFRSPRALYEPLLEKGILIRPCGNYPNLDSSYYRIGVKRREENRRLLSAVREVLHG